MKLPLFLYNFSKTYIPAVILLCIFYSLTQNVSNITKTISYPKKTETETRQTITPTTQPESASKKTIAPKPKPRPEAPKYYYLVEFKTGGSMEAKEIKANNNLVKIIISDSYDLTMSKNDIKSIKRYKL